MKRAVFWGAVLWLCLCEIQGLQHVFVLHGKDLLLDVMKPFVLDKKADFMWKFNSSLNVAKFNLINDPFVFDNYEGRAVFFGQNYSLLLKGVKHDDSGNYTAVVVGAQDETVAEYMVTVQDPVSPVNLAVTSSGSDSCNITVTCSTVDSYMNHTFRCHGKNCSGEEQSLNTTNYYSLTVYFYEDFIICNHSNKVSWKQSKQRNPYCETNSVSRKAFMIAGLAVVGAIFVTVAIVMQVRWHVFDWLRGKIWNLKNTTREAPQDVPPG